MVVKTLEMNGNRYAMMREEDYKELLARAEARGPAAAGLLPAAHARDLLARKLIKARRAAGLSQTVLARAAGIRPETVNRIERGKTRPDVATLTRIEQAMIKLQAAEF